MSYLHEVGDDLSLTGLLDRNKNVAYGLVVLGADRDFTQEVPAWVGNADEEEQNREGDRRIDAVFNGSKDRRKHADGPDAEL